MTSLALLTGYSAGRIGALGELLIDQLLGELELCSVLCGLLHVVCRSGVHLFDQGLEPVEILCFARAIENDVELSAGQVLMQL